MWTILSYAWFFTTNTTPKFNKNVRNIDYDYSTTAYFAGWCFWCMESIFEKQDGVEWAYSGYIGWEESTATYELTSAWNTGHREAVRVVYDPNVITYRKLVELFWTQINPTDDGWQFNDRGFVYSPAIFYSSNQEREMAQLSKQELQESWRFQKDILVAIESAKEFYDAEDYHQDYYKKNPIRYNVYTAGSGRKSFIQNNWQDRIDDLQWKDYVNGELLPSIQFSSKGGNIDSQSELKERLTPLQYKVTQQEGTEPAFNNKYWNNKEAWIYVDIIDGTPLYSSLDKFDSGTGWPSFTQSIDANNLTTHIDTRFFMTRTKVDSKSSWAHLWHIFNDAPPELWGIRHCINSASLRFVSVDDLELEGYWEYLEIFEE